MKMSSRPSSTPYGHETAMQTKLRGAVGERAAGVVGQKLLEFCHLLRANGIGVTASRIIDTYRALKVIDVFRRDDFYTVLEANLVSRTSDCELFRQLFLRFWSGPTWEMPPDPCLPAWEDDCVTPAVLQQPQMHVEGWDVRSAEGSEEAPQAVALYSPQEVLTRKDFGKMA